MRKGASDLPVACLVGGCLCGVNAARRGQGEDTPAGGESGRRQLHGRRAAVGSAALLIESTSHGLYCEAGDFFIDPWAPVDRAVITHAHADHARAGSEAYLTAEPGMGLLRERLGAAANLQGQPYEQPMDLNGVAVTFFPAGHILGSAQIRVEFAGEVWVVSGDYKLATDPTCAAFVPVPCDVFLTEATFANPVFQWRRPPVIFGQIDDWWLRNQAAGRTSVLLADGLGMTQRLLAGLDATMGPLFAQGAARRFLSAYAAAGVELSVPVPAAADVVRAAQGRGLILAPPAMAEDAAWLGSLGPVSTALVSGGMQVLGVRRRQRNIERGFVFSDHADWNGLVTAIQASEARHVLVTHGQVEELVRWLRRQGFAADGIATKYAGEMGSEAADAEGAAVGS